MTEIKAESEDDAIAIVRLAKKKGIPTDVVERKTSFITGTAKVVVKNEKYTDKVVEAANEYNRLKKQVSDLKNPGGDESQQEGDGEPA